MKANHSYEVMQLTRGGSSHFKEMANSLPSISVGSAATPVHVNLQTNTSRNIASRSGVNSSAYASQNTLDEKSIHYGFPCETDHMYANCGDTGKYQELVTEVEQLKALLLFHLDLIQQQSECNASKDKQLSELRQENEMLRQKLGCMERRVLVNQINQLSREATCDNASHEQPPVGETCLLSPVPHIRNIKAAQGSEPVQDSKLKSPEPITGGTSLLKQEEESTIPRTRVKTLLPVRSTSIVTVNNDEMSTNDVPELQNFVNSISEFIPKLEDENTVTQASSDPVDSHLGDLLLPDIEIDPYPQIGATEQCSKNRGKHSKKERRGVTTLSSKRSTLPELKRIQRLLAQKPVSREVSHLTREDVMSTEQHYVTHVGEFQTNNHETISFQVEVEVPQWSVKPISSRYSTQEIENLDDEVFSKRHLKHEIDEKRRKRWDLQRIREQRQYEKLRARYEGEDRSQDRRPSSSCNRERNGEDCNPISSLWQQPEDATHIQVEPWLPICAFGAPLANVAQTFPTSMDEQSAVAMGNEILYWRINKCPCKCVV